ncbi:unnamed protein product [Vicia faba]|uniref:Uncharacterized protein n=1 Tax=Vicia faba TaxID=3906 RepID=A0AAV1A4G7_VICFA|nr:unnamed protein product [Vicia faba]
MIAHSTKELYKRHCPSSLTRYCWIGLSPIVQDSPLLPPVGVRAVSQSQLIKQRFLAFFRIWPELFGRFPRITHPFATLFSTVPTSWARQATFTLGASFPSAQLPENNVRLACVKHIASVPSEPGSNSSFEYDWALQW